MLVICEDCSKKYNIDESKMKSSRARFNCYECGHIIVVIKGETSATGIDDNKENASKMTPS